MGRRRQRARRSSSSSTSRLLRRWSGTGRSSPTRRSSRSRVRNGKAAHFAVRQVDAFEESWGGPCYFQAYEFVENGADLQQMLDEEREQHRRTKSAPTARPRGLGTSRHLGQGLHDRNRGAARIQDRARRSETGECLSDPGSDDRLRLPAQADRHGFLAAGRPAGAVARVPGICRHRQLPLSRAPHARVGAGACLGRLHLRADALRASRWLSSLLERGPGRVCPARAGLCRQSRPRLLG